MAHDLKTVGELLEAVRKQQPEVLTKSAWAERAHISNTELSFYLNGRRLPSKEKLAQLLAVVTVSSHEERSVYLQREYEAAHDLETRADVLMRQIPKRVPAQMRALKDINTYLRDWVIP